MPEINPISVAVFYFSQGGHTKTIVERFIQKFQSYGYKIDVYNCAERENYDVFTYDFLVFATPIYFYRAPEIWWNVIDCINNLDTKKAILLFTCGNGMEKEAHLVAEQQLIAALSARNCLVFDSFRVVCADTYPPFKKAGMGEGRPTDTDLKKIDVFVENVQQCIVQHKFERIKKVNTVTVYKLKLLGLLARLLSPKLRFIAKKCTKCGYCIAGCPVQAIDWQQGSIVFSKACIKCYWCEQCCPGQAIAPRWKILNSLARFFTTHLYHPKY